MDELDLTKGALTPIPCALSLSLFLHPSLPLLSGARPRSCSPPVLGSRVWKNRRVEKVRRRNDRRWAEGSSVSVSSAVARPFTVVMDIETQSTQRKGVSVCGSDPGNGRNVDGQRHSPGRSACAFRHTAARKLHNVRRPSIHHSTWANATHYPHTTHIYCMLSMSSHTKVPSVLKHTTYWQTLKWNCQSHDWVSRFRCCTRMLYSPAGSAEWRRADRRAQLPAVPEPHLSAPALQNNTRCNRVTHRNRPQIRNKIQSRGVWW